MAHDYFIKAKVCTCTKGSMAITVNHPIEVQAPEVPTYVKYRHCLQMRDIRPFLYLIKYVAIRTV